LAKKQIKNENNSCHSRTLRFHTISRQTDAGFGREKTLDFFERVFLFGGDEGDEKQFLSLQIN
jgi:hypothetical protein